MMGRAPLQALLQLESAHAMAPASAARGLLQRFCVTGPFRSASSAAAGVEAAAAGSEKATSRSVSVLDSFRVVSEQSILPRSVSWGRAGAAARTSCAAAGGRVSCPARQYNSGSSGSSISSDNFSWEHFSRSYAMQFSTVPATEQNASENVPTENLTSTETVVTDTVVVGAEPSSLELEFAPGNENTPSTPLMQAIQSQESVSTEDVSPSSSPHEQLRDVFSDTESAPARGGALLETDSDRVIQPGRIYVGALPFEMKGDELRDALRELCGKYGTVLDVNLAQHRNQSQKSIMAGKHRGFAFVMMETPDQAQDVIDKLNGASVWGRALMVSYGLKKIEPDPLKRLTSSEQAVVRCKVFVGNLHEGTSREDLETKFQQYGTVIDVKLITELHSHRSRGFGFVTFTEEGQAMRAVLDCDGSILDGSVIRVNIAKYPQGLFYMMNSHLKSYEKLTFSTELSTEQGLGLDSR